MRRGGGHLLLPVEISPWLHRSRDGLALNDDAMIRFVIRSIDGGVEQWFVLDDSVDLDATRSRYNHLRCAVVDANRQLTRCEAPEHH